MNLVPNPQAHARGYTLPPSSRAVGAATFVVRRQLPNENASRPCSIEHRDERHLPRFHPNWRACAGVPSFVLGRLLLRSAYSPCGRWGLHPLARPRSLSTLAADLLRRRSVLAVYSVAGSIR